jgi:hypothetical protein
MSAAFEEVSDGTEVTLVFEKLPPACGRRTTRPARASVWSSSPAASNDGTEDSLGGALRDDPTTLSLRSPAADRASGANLTLGTRLFLRHARERGCNPIPTK